MDKFRVPVGRGSYDYSDFPPQDEALDTKLASIFEEHCSSRNADWRYRQRVCRQLSLPERIEERLPRMVRLAYANASKPKYLSLIDVAAIPVIAIATVIPDSESPFDLSGFVNGLPQEVVASGVPVIASADSSHWGHLTSSTLTVSRTLTKVGYAPDGTWLHFLEHKGDEPAWRSYDSVEVNAAEVAGADEDIVLVKLHSPTPGFRRFWINPKNEVYRLLVECFCEDAVPEGTFTLNLDGEERKFLRALALILGMNFIKFQTGRSQKLIQAEVDKTLVSLLGAAQRDGADYQVDASWDGTALKARRHSS